MAYMGDTPKFENIRWKNAGATAPSSPEAGQFYYNTGTGTISEGFWIYASADGTSTGAKDFRRMSPTNSATNLTTGYLASNIGGVPVGTVLTFTRDDSTDALPSGYLLCDGVSISQTTYSALYTVVGTAFGDGSTGTGATGTGNFNIPDFRGFFLRGRVYTSTSTRDADNASRTALTAGGNATHNMGSYQTDAYVTHTHQITNNIIATGSPYQLAGSGYTQSASATSVTSGPSAGNTSTNETRPKNIYVEYIIKY
jgi:microcystin-dependent protein